MYTFSPQLNFQQNPEDQKKLQQLTKLNQENFIGSICILYNQEYQYSCKKAKQFFSYMITNSAQQLEIQNDINFMIKDISHIDFHNLIKLKLQILNSDASLEYFQLMNLPNLKQMDLNCITFQHISMRKLNLPQLQYLKIQAQNILNLDFISQQSFPNLQTALFSYQYSFSQLRINIGYDWVYKIESSTKVSKNKKQNLKYLQLPLIKVGNKNIPCRINVFHGIEQKYRKRFQSKLQFTFGGKQFDNFNKIK